MEVSKISRQSKQNKERVDVFSVVVNAILMFAFLFLSMRIIENGTFSNGIINTDFFFVTICSFMCSKYMIKFIKATKLI